MTWDDYRPIPGAEWNKADQTGSRRQLRVALVTADFPDQPFVMTLPRHSDLYGNPQIDPVSRERIPQFYADFYNSVGPLNRGRTIHEYWMEQSRGEVGVTVVPYGPYRMPKNSFQYGGLAQEDLPSGFTPDAGGAARHLDSLWRADRGDSVIRDVDVILRIFAGYDETAMWQPFGEMKFQSRNDVPAAWGNPDTTRRRWVPTRYAEWTSWQAGKWLWSNSAIIQGEATNTIRHEIGHFAFGLVDNYNNPYLTPYRRAPAGPWDLMDRGSFNGPGGPHRRWVAPPIEGGSMSAGLMLRQRLAATFLDSSEVLFLSRDALARAGIAVAKVTARAVRPTDDAIAGIVVRLDGALPHDRTPPDDASVNPLSSGVPDYNFYTMEVVQRIGYDSFTPDDGVLIAKNKDRATPTGGQNGFDTYTWVIDANPHDIKKLDFVRPDGDSVMRSVADYRQLNDALFKAGPNSGSAYEWIDAANRIHFMIVDVNRSAQNVLSYTVAVRSIDQRSPHSHGALLDGPAGVTVGAGASIQSLTLRNTGRASAVQSLTTQRRFFAADVYKLSVSVAGAGWDVGLRNELVAVEFGAEVQIPLHLRAQANAVNSRAGITLTATSMSDASKSATYTFTVTRRPN